MSPDTAVRVAAGTTELLWSGRATRRRPADRVVVVGSAALGLRNLTQAVVVARHPTSTSRRVSAVIDLAHAGSMLLAARRWSSRRSLCWASAGMATTLAAASWYAARRAG